MKKLILIVFISTVTVAQPQYTGISGRPGAFSRMGFGARGMGMGNAMSAITEGNLVSYYNPALTVFQEKNSFQTSYSFLSLDRRLNFLSYTRRFDLYSDYDDKNGEPRSSAGISIGLINSGVSDIDGRDESGNPTGALSTSENQFFFGFAKKFGKRFSLGVEIKYYHFNLTSDFSSSSLGLDIGVLYILNQNINLSFVLTDLNSRYKWDTSPVYGIDGSVTEDQFPLLKKIGISYTNQKLGLITALEYENSNAGTNILRAGAEFNVVDQFYLRGGIDQYNLSNSDFPVRPSLGFSYYKTFGDLVIGVDYAYVVERYSPEDRHIVGLNFRF